MLFCHLVTKNQIRLKPSSCVLLHSSCLKQRNVDPEGHNTVQNKHRRSLLLQGHFFLLFYTKKKKALTSALCFPLGTSSIKKFKGSKEKNRTFSVQQLMSCTFGSLDNRKCLCSTCEHKVQHKRRQQGVLHKEERQK